MHIRFEWDEEKNALNIQARGREGDRGLPELPQKFLDDLTYKR